MQAIGHDSYVPNLIVNDNGQLIVSNSNVRNDNDGRALVRFRKVVLKYAFAPTANLAARFSEFSLNL